MNERPIPDAAQRDAASVEMLRVWVAEKQLHCSLKIGMYRDGMGVDEELAWGTILADAARHIARALHPEDAVEESAALQKLLHRLNEELAAPTTGIKGGVSSSAEHLRTIMWSLPQTIEDTQRFLLRRMRMVPEFGAAMTVNSRPGASVRLGLRLDKHKSKSR